MIPPPATGEGELSLSVDVDGEPETHRVAVPHREIGSPDVVVEVDPAEGIIVIEKAYGEQKILAELEAPSTFCNMLEVGETYFFTYIHDKGTPHIGRMETFRTVSEP